MSIALRLLGVVVGLVALVPGQEPAPAKDTRFSTTVAPILSRHCLKCHGPERQKGGVRFDERALAPGQAVAAKVLVAGDAKKSALVDRVRRAADDEGCMPPKGPRLGAEDIAALERWIAAGALLDGPLSVDAVPEATARAETGSAAPPELPATLSAEEAKAVGALRARGARVEPLSAASPTYRLDLTATALEAADEILDLARPLVPRLADVALSRGRVTSAGLAVLAAAPRLERLRLDDTAVGDDAVLALGACPRLSSLNLCGTRVTNEAMRKLAETKSLFPALKRVYLWRSAVGPKGFSLLRAARPELRLETGAVEDRR